MRFSQYVTKNLVHTMTESTDGKGQRSCKTNGPRLSRWPSPSFHTNLVAIRPSTLAKTPQDPKSPQVAGVPKIQNAKLKSIVLASISGNKKTKIFLQIC